MKFELNNEVNLNSKDFIVLLRDLLYNGYVLTFKAKGKSMRPFIIDGSKISARSAISSQLSRGDVILYSRDDSVVVHRFFGLNRNGANTLLIARGDCQSIFEIVREEDLLGKVAAIEIKGKIIKFDNSLIRLIGTLISLIILPLIMLRDKVYFN